MHQHYDSATQTYINTDEQGIVRGLTPEKPIASDADTAQVAAQEYLEQHAELLGVEPAALENLTAEREAQPVDAGSEFRIHTEKQQFDTATVAYHQTALGLPVWERGVAVQMTVSPFRVLSSQSTQHPDVHVEAPDDDALKRAESLSTTALAGRSGCATAPRRPARSSRSRDAARRLPVRGGEARGRAVSPRWSEEEGGSTTSRGCRSPSCRPRSSRASTTSRRSCTSSSARRSSRFCTGGRSSTWRPGPFSASSRSSTTSTASSSRIDPISTSPSARLRARRRRRSTRSASASRSRA